QLGFQRFYWLSLAFDFMLFLPMVMMPLLDLVRLRYQIAVLAIVLFLISYLFVRLIIIFPAFAVDAPGATLKNAYTDAKDRSWRTFGILLLAHLPFVLALLALSMMAVRDQKAERSW